VSAAPASAQHRREGGGEQRRENAAPRGEQRTERSQPQAQPRAEQRAQPQQQQQQPQQQQQVQRAPEQRAIPRGEYRSNGRDDRAVRPEYRAPQYAVPRSEAPRYSAPRYDNRRYDGRSYNNGSRYYNSGRYYGPRYSGPRFSVAPRRFYRPYYVFRPRLSIGFGIWAGFPVTYYDPYYYPYAYSAYPGYPGYSSGGVYVNPGPNTTQSNMGGVSFDITPDSAEVWVDGNYMGQVADYTASSQPLGLTAGRHHIELREPGFQVSSFDVDVIPGQVIPFQGQLEN